MFRILATICPQTYKLHTSHYLNLNYIISFAGWDKTWEGGAGSASRPGCPVRCHGGADGVQLPTGRLPQSGGLWLRYLFCSWYTISWSLCAMRNCNDRSILKCACVEWEQSFLFSAWYCESGTFVAHVVTRSNVSSQAEYRYTGRYQAS